MNELETSFVLTIRQHVPEGESLMLGYSGGPDSEALLQLSLASDLHKKYSLHLVHIDHGWREESYQEAMMLQEKARKLGLPFHLLRLSPLEAVGNLENWSRQQRLGFFEEIGKKIGSKWLLLGHHKNDSMEVVLRRLMEGSHLVHASGIEFLSRRGSIHILRPLLAFEKEELLLYVKTKGCSWIHDTTNEDVRLQRASMRKRLFPTLSDLFGKNITSSLHQIASEASLLQDHIEEELKQKFLWHCSENAVWCQKKEGEGYSLFLLMQAIHSGVSSLQESLNRQQELQAAHVLLSSKNESKLFAMKNLSLYIDQSSFLLLKRQPLLLFPSHLLLEKEGEYRVGSYLISVQRTQTMSSKRDPFELLRDGFTFYVKNLPLLFMPANEKNSRAVSCKTFDRLPASFRKKTPVCLSGDKIVALPCAGWSKEIEKNDTLFCVTIQIKWKS